MTSPSSFNYVESLSLDKLRGALIRQEETIIFSLIERAQFKVNNLIYETDSGPKFQLKAAVNFDGCFMDYLLLESEKVYARVRRYTSPEEHAFFPGQLPKAILPQLEYPAVIKPNTVNANSRISETYKQKIVPLMCQEGDDQNYGSSAVADVQCLQALSKRIHYGKFIAEAKFLQQRELYTKLIKNKDTEKIMELLTDKKVEERLLKRVQLKASTYGRDITDTPGESPSQNFKIDPAVVAQIYEKWIIPLTKEVEVEYLMQRLGSTAPNGSDAHGTASGSLPLSPPFEMDLVDIAFLGPLGTFTHQAVLDYFGTSSSALVPCSSIDDVFSAVSSGKTRYGVVPVENSYEGPVVTTFDNLVSENNTKIQICGEEVVQVVHNLVVRPNVTDLKQITKRVYSHPQAIAQCRTWLKKHLPGVELVEVASTAKAAQMIAESKDEDGCAAISSECAANLTNMKVLRSHINDMADNRTRFFVLSDKQVDDVPEHAANGSGPSKTILLLRNVTQLDKVFEAFVTSGVGIVKMDTRPSRTTPWQYHYIVQLKRDHHYKLHSHELFTLLQTYCEKVNVLGTVKIRE